MCKAGIHQKSDERLLRDSDLLEEALAWARAASAVICLIRWRYWIRTIGAMGTRIDSDCSAGHARTRQEEAERKSHSILCFSAVKELGRGLTGLAVRLGISVPTVSVAVSVKL